MLDAYHQKRDFTRTREPRGAGASRPGLYVVQKHAASQLHYDLRLELDGVLKSWAVPKGPSLDPKQKRLAVQTEDHPVEYADFEGTIPRGEYGGGTVMLWDRGRWEPEGSAAEGFNKGRLHFRLSGERLQGEWLLMRMTSSGNAKNWLLMYRGGMDGAVAAPDITERETRSVASGRSMDEIAAG